MVRVSGPGPVQLTVDGVFVGLVFWPVCRELLLDGLKPVLPSRCSFAILIKELIQIEERGRAPSSGDGCRNCSVLQFSGALGQRPSTS